MINKSKILVKIAQQCLKNPKTWDNIKASKKTSWPLAFVQYCIKQVDSQADQEEFMGNVADDEGFGGSFSPSYGHSSIFKFHDCSEIWENIDKKFKLKKAVPGSLVIWKKSDETFQISIVIKVIDAYSLTVIEGSESKVIKKNRSLKKGKDLALLGVVTPWH